MDSTTLCGPVHSQMIIDTYTKGLTTIKEQGGKIIYGGERIEREGYYVKPTIVEIAHDAPIVQEELFCPILYLMKYKTFEEAVAINNMVA